MIDIIIMTESGATPPPLPPPPNPNIHGLPNKQGCLNCLLTGIQKAHIPILQFSMCKTTACAARGLVLL